MDQLHQLSAQYNALWIETNQLYETWARQRECPFMSCW